MELMFIIRSFGRCIADAGIVDKEVDASSFGQHFIDQFRHGCVIGHVAGQHANAIGSFGGSATAGAKDLEARLLEGLAVTRPMPVDAPVTRATAGLSLFMDIIARLRSMSC